MSMRCVIVGVPECFSIVVEQSRVLVDNFMLHPAPWMYGMKLLFLLIAPQATEFPEEAVACLIPWSSASVRSSLTTSLLLHGER